ncbi:Reverse transcriptase (RNA-dependent DNA polymerase) [Popillia japonica]|uniref:Reverse transcriptase (RNA-dependent DNA polymerase) n=1 Tax=Popillia japonica TaxID=7064 RepID=A0AAW1L6P5_POPJA
MLDTAGKILEKLLKARLRTAVETAGDLSPRQYRFRKGRSIIDALQEICAAVSRAESYNHFSRRIVLLVTLDVKNAFNSAKWKDFMDALMYNFRVPTYLLKMMDSYLKDRCLSYETMSGERNITVTSDAVQGSILGPDLWNILYDNLLRIQMPEEVTVVGYADDIAVLISVRDIDAAQLKLNQAMRKIESWMQRHGLSLALHKTEIVILTKRRIETTIPVKVGAAEVMTKPTIKYLGINVDCKMTFWPQIRRTADKAATMITNLARLMANIGGPSAKKRRLLMASYHDN